MSQKELIEMANNNAAEIRRQAEQTGATLLEVNVPVPTIVCSRCGFVLSRGNQPAVDQSGCYHCITLPDEQAVICRSIRISR